MLLPVSDENDDYAFPWVNVSLIGICVAVFIWQSFLPPVELWPFFENFGFVSGRYLPGYEALSVTGKLWAMLKAFFDPFSQAWVQALSATFIHAGPAHLLGNMLFLWIFGDNVEHVMGRIRYPAFFLLTGFLSQFAQTLIGGAIDIPCIGASGAISAVMGAYLVYHPRAIVNVYLLPVAIMLLGRMYEFSAIRMKARNYLLFYFCSQLLSGYMTWGEKYPSVAVWAHIGGYAFGFLLARLFRDPEMMFKEEADRLFGQQSDNGQVLERNVYNEYVFRSLSRKRSGAEHKRPPLSSMREKNPHRAKRQFGWKKDKRHAGAHRKTRHVRPRVADILKTGHREAQRRKRMGSDWMKQDKAFDEAGQGSYFAHLGAACRAFAEYPGIWFFCGGTALDLFLGRPIRTRQDIDIGVLRDEQDLLPKHFPGVRISYVNPGSPAKAQWKGAPLTLPVHELYLELPGTHLELLLNEATDSHWVYRRDARITRDLSKAVLNTEQGIPYLAPEIVLLYKSKHMRDRDIVDYNAAIGALDPEQKAWLQTALDTVYLQAHPWTEVPAK